MKVIFKEIENFINHILHGRYDQAEKVFTVDDFLHDGIDFAEFMEMEKYAFRDSVITEILKEGLHVKIISIMDMPELNTSHVTFGIYDNDGMFIYEDTFGFDLSGLDKEKLVLTGNRRHFEVVAKLFIDHDGKTHRAAGIRMNTGAKEIASIIPRARGVHGLDADFPTLADDGFRAIRFDIENDDFKTRMIGLKVTPKGGRPHNEYIRFRGVDHPQYEPNLWPYVGEKYVIIPKMNMHPWALGVQFKDGMHEYMPFPGSGVVNFCKEIESATLTDALDNDWETISRKY